MRCSQPHNLHQLQPLPTWPKGLISLETIPSCLLFSCPPCSARRMERTCSSLGRILTNDHFIMSNDTLRDFAVMYVNKTCKRQKLSEYASNDPNYVCPALHDEGIYVVWTGWGANINPPPPPPPLLPPPRVQHAPGQVEHCPKGGRARMSPPDPPGEGGWKRGICVGGLDFGLFWGKMYFPQKGGS